MTRSWVIEKRSDGYINWFYAMAVEGNGRSEEINPRYVRHRRSYFVVYKGKDVPETLCDCQMRGFVRLEHIYSWADAPWVPFIMWGA